VGNADEGAGNGYVMHIENNNAFIDLGKQSGIQVGAIVSIYEEEKVFHPITQQDMGTIDVEIGRARVVEVYDEGALVEIIKKGADKEILVAQKVKPLPQESQKATEQKVQQTIKQIEHPANNSLPLHSQSGSLSKKLFWASLITGSAFGVGSLYYHRQSNIAYGRYNTATTAEEAEKFRKETISRDQRKRAFAGVSSIVFVSSFILLWRGRTPDNTNSLITPLNNVSLTLSPEMNIAFRWTY